MKWPFKRRRLSADVIAVPVERAGTDMVARFLTGDPIALIELHLTRQSMLRAEDRNDELIDALLELRNMLTVPVIPGRPQ